MERKKIVLTVTNDVHTDNRVNRTCMVLLENGFEVTVVGRNWPDNSGLNRSYHVHRFTCWFNSGALFYLEFQCRLLMYLINHRFDFYLANDIDTAYPVYLASTWFKKPFVLDSHEYFTASPELEGRALVKGIWKWIERRVVPRVKNGFAVTVSHGIAETFEKEYGVRFKVIRNIPDRMEGVSEEKFSLRERLGLPVDKKILILQGSGINKDRGAEEMLEAMRYMPDYLLLVVGKGDVVPHLMQRVHEESWEDRVRFVPRQPVEILRQYTRASDMGLSLDKDTNLNYHFSLPNKIFDYMHAHIPVFASNLPEVRSIVEGNGFGVVFMEHDPSKMADLLIQTLGDDERLRVMSSNAQRASEVLNWQSEKVHWEEVIHQLFEE